MVKLLRRRARTEIDRIRHAAPHPFSGSSDLMLYPLLLLLLLLSAACAGFSNPDAAPAQPPTPGVVLTPPPTAAVTPAVAPSPTLPAPAPHPTAPPAHLSTAPPPPPPPPPSPSPTPGRPPTAANQRIPYVQVTAGKFHSCALRADGVAHCWGQNSHGATNVPARMRFRQISAGLDFTCGLRYAGDITCWGGNSQGQTNAPAGQFTQIAAGRQHACALDQNGKAVCWGDLASPAADFAFTTIGSGFKRSCGLTIAGDLECWNAAGHTRSHAGPFTALSVGLHHICTLRPTGAAVCYGGNEDYESAPPQTAFATIAAGWRHSCGITRANGFIECWGAGVRAQPGQRLAAPAGVFTTLSSGWSNYCALRPDGAAQCWHQPSQDPSVRVPEHFSIAFGGKVFDLPVELFPWPTGGLAVVERAGVIQAYDADGSAAAPRPILDLNDQVATFVNRGMVSAALDPDFDQFPFLYVYYHQTTGTASRPETKLSRFPVVDGAAVRAAELVILTLPDVALIRLGGAIRFGPDGMLYLSIGDNDHDDNAQNLASRHGKIIRINVRGATAAQPYRIPDDNPFAATPGAQPEIWAYGMRNPWRMDFDAAGNLWVADVGANSEEEVSLAAAGANLGWPIFEGSLCRLTAAECAALRAAATAPVVVYQRDEGRAIIGGVGSPQPGIAFLFGDLVSRRIWALEPDAASDTGWRRREIAQANGSILAFGRDAAGAVYVLLQNRAILRLEW